MSLYILKKRNTNIRGLQDIYRAHGFWESVSYHCLKTVVVVVVSCDIKFEGNNKSSRTKNGVYSRK